MVGTIARVTKEEGNAAKREYMRRYRAKNKERLKAYNDAYWQRKAAEQKQEALSCAENR